MTRVAVILGDSGKPDPFKITPSLDHVGEAAQVGLKAALEQLPEYRYAYFTDHNRLLADLTAQRSDIDLVLNFCDQGFGNDPLREAHVPALLELLELPFTGGGPRCLTACYDKLLVYAVAAGIGVPVPRSAGIRTDAIAWNGPFPAFVKPNFADGGFGIARQSVVQTRGDLNAAVHAIRDQFGYDDLFIVQEYLPGADLSVGVLGNAPDFTVLPVLEECYAGVPVGVPHVGSYEAKWDSEQAGSPYRTVDWIRATLPPDTERAIAAWSCALFTRLECRDYARFDWRLDAAGAPRLLEVNPNPGWDYWTYLATMAGWADIEYPELLRRILAAALLRTAANRRTTT